MAWIAGGFHPPAQQSLSRIQRNLVGRLRYLAALWVGGIVVLSAATFLCFRLNVDFATTSLIFLVIIVLLSLMDSFVSSAILSVFAVASLDYFFIEPIFEFDVGDPKDVTTLAAFLITSLAVTSLVRRVRHLGEAQREQARLLDLTHDPVIVRDLNDVIRYWNRGAERLYGWKREEAIGKSPVHLLQTSFPVPIEQAKKTLLDTGRWEGELLRTTRDGTPVLVACRWTLERDDNGRPLGTLETNNDITDRKRAEEALRRTQETYLTEAQQLSRTGSFGWNVSSGEVFWSEETYRIFGYDTRTKPSIATVVQRVYPDDIALVRQVIEQATQGHQDFEFEHRLLMPDGAVKHVHVVAHAVREEPDKLLFMGALMDITARKKAEGALRDSEQRYRQLFHYMPIALWQLNRRGLTELYKGLRAEGVVDLAAYLDRNPGFLDRAMDALIIEEVNERAVEMFGARDPSELIGPVTRFWRDRPGTLRRALEAQFRGEPTFEEETRVATLDGRVIDVLFATAWPGQISELGMGLVGLVEITERVRAQERLQQVRAEFAHAARISMLGELAASIAHEVNQPLGAMTTNGETGLRWLNRPEPNVAKAAELFQRIVADARRAADIIARIRTMAAGRPPQWVVLSLNGLIEESIVFLHNELQSKGVSVSLDLEPAHLQVTGDRTQLQQVIVNLAINAVQAMAQSDTERATLLIRSRLSDPETVCCTFEDSGPGIGTENLNHLFDSFFTTKDAGMGMGLPISRSIIEAHGGRIRADNKSGLGGARFSFDLPISDGMAS